MIVFGLMPDLNQDYRFFELHQRIVDEYEFVGVTGQKSIQADFLSNLMVNYD